MLQLTTRNDLPILLNSLGYTGWGAEIGVWRGDFSAHILAAWPGKMLLVDSWWVQPQIEYRDLRNSGPQYEQELHYQAAVITMSQFPAERYRIMRTFSTEAAKEVTDGSLDFVYIDANHRYDYVKQDLETWYPKVRVGGLLSGHDFLDGDACNTDFGVKQAVTEFADALPYKPELYIIREDWPSWYFLKEAE